VFVLGLVEALEAVNVTGCDICHIMGARTR
jgi:hypothetical protein